MVLKYLKKMLVIWRSNYRNDIYHGDHYHLIRRYRELSHPEWNMHANYWRFVYFILLGLGSLSFYDCRLFVEETTEQIYKKFPFSVLWKLDETNFWPNNDCLNFYDFLNFLNTSLNGLDGTHETKEFTKRAWNSLGFFDPWSDGSHNWFESIEDVYKLSPFLWKIRLVIQFQRSDTKPRELRLN